MFWIEAIAALFGLICVWLTLRQHIACWPTGLVQVSLYIVIFYDARLYSDLLLHVVYVFLQLYGWYHWLYGGTDRTALPVTRIAPFVTALWAGAALGGAGLWGYGMATWTDAAVPYADAFTTVTSLIAQWLMARKRLESTGGRVLMIHLRPHIEKVFRVIHAIPDGGLFRDRAELDKYLESIQRNSKQGN